MAENPRFIKAVVSLYQLETGLYVRLSKEERIHLVVIFWFWLSKKAIYDNRIDEYLDEYERILHDDNLDKRLLFTNATHLGFFISFLFSRYAHTISGQGYFVSSNLPGELSYKPQLVLTTNDGQVIDIPNATAYLRGE